MTIPCRKACPGQISNGKRGKQIYFEGEVYSCPRCGTEYEIEVSMDGIVSLKPTGKTHAVVTRPVDSEREAALAEARALRQQANARKHVAIRRMAEEGLPVLAIAREVRMSHEKVREILVGMGLHMGGKVSA